MCLYTHLPNYTGVVSNTKSRHEGVGSIFKYSQRQCVCVCVIQVVKGVNINRDKTKRRLKAQLPMYTVAVYCGFSTGHVTCVYMYNYQLPGP